MQSHFYSLALGFLTYAVGKEIINLAGLDVHYMVHCVMGSPGWVPGATASGRDYKAVVKSSWVCDYRAPSGVRVQPWSMK